MGRKRNIGKKTSTNQIIHDRFTEAVKTEIENRKLTYYRIAKDTGISTAALSRFRQPGGTLKTSSLIRLIDYLEIDLVINRDDSRVIFKAHGPHSIE